MHKRFEITNLTLDKIILHFKFTIFWKALITVKMMSGVNSKIYTHRKFRRYEKKINKEKWEVHIKRLCSNVMEHHFHFTVEGDAQNTQFKGHSEKKYVSCNKQIYKAIETNY